MTDKEFLYWLQGYFEITNNSTLSLTEEKTKKILEHIDLARSKRNNECSYKDVELVEYIAGLFALWDKLNEEQKWYAGDQAKTALAFYFSPQPLGGYGWRFPSVIKNQ